MISESSIINKMLFDVNLASYCLTRSKDEMTRDTFSFTSSDQASTFSCSASRIKMFLIISPFSKLSDELHFIDLQHRPFRLRFLFSEKLPVDLETKDVTHSSLTLTIKYAVPLSS